MPRKRIAIGLVVVALVIAVVAGMKSGLTMEFKPVGVGVDAPDFSVVTLDSVPRKKTLDDYKGQVLLINLWATWCGPCRVEMPSIVDDPGTDAEIRSFVKEYGITFEVLHDTGGQEGKVSRDYQTSGYPETLIIGRDGIIRKKLLGAHNWNSPENRALIDRLLAEKS